MNRNIYSALLILITANSYPIVNSFNISIQTSIPHMHPQPACTMAINYSTCRQSPIHRTHTPICPAKTYAPCPLLNNPIDTIACSLAEMADYTIATFCNTQPITYQKTSQYALHDMHTYACHISRNWYSFIDAHSSYIYHLYDHKHISNQNNALRWILNSLERIKTAALMPRYAYPIEERFHLITSYIAQDLRSAAYITDIYTHSYRTERALQDIAFLFDRIARNLESLAYCY